MEAKCQARLDKTLKGCADALQTYENGSTVKVFKIPTEWGMFTDRGEKNLTRKAIELVKKVTSDDHPNKKLVHFKEFNDGWRSLFGTKTMNEADDTFVSDEVIGFAVDLSMEVGVDPRNVSQIMGVPVDSWNCINPKIERKYWWACNK